MDNFSMSQILKITLILALLLVPLLSSSIRSTYLYFVFNLLIIVLGAEAGLLSSSKASQEVKPSSVMVSPKPSLVKPEVNFPEKEELLPSSITSNELASLECTPKKAKVVEKSSSVKIVGARRVRRIKKCPSTPSLFFIGGGEINEVEEVLAEEDEVEEIGVPSGQELYTKAEMFIGNFYKQLKLQREESWKRIHGFLQ